MASRYFKVNKINVRYGDIQVFWDIESTADKGEIIVLVGSNGTGKSTTVKSCAGLTRPLRENVRLDGHDLTGTACRTLTDHNVTLVPEGRQLLPSMTTCENLEMGASSKAARTTKKDTIKRICDWFPKLKDRKNQLAGTLSRGERQMFASSRGMMELPKLLIMGEPSPGLALNTVDNVFFVAKEVVQEPRLIIILVERDVRKALRIINRGCVIENGQVIVSGTAEELLSDNEVKKTYLGFQSTVGSYVSAAAEIG